MNIKNTKQLVKQCLANENAETELNAKISAKNIFLENSPSIIMEILAKNDITENEALICYEYANYVFSSLEKLMPSGVKLALQALYRAANFGLDKAQLLYGLHLCQLDKLGQRATKSLNYYSYRSGSLKKAVQWIELAAKQKNVTAWYVLAIIYRRTQFSGYDAKYSNQCLLRAAELDHGLAQIKLAKCILRTRKKVENAEVLACFWLLKAIKNNISEAEIILQKIAESHPNSKENQWFNLLKILRQKENIKLPPILMQRIILANQFNLNKAELLLINIIEAVHEHCLVINIRNWLPRSSKRLIIIETDAQKEALAKAKKVWLENKLSSQSEGTYQRRQYIFSNYENLDAG